MPSPLGLAAYGSYGATPEQQAMLWAKRRFPYSFLFNQDEQPEADGYRRGGSVRRQGLDTGGEAGGGPSSGLNSDGLNEWIRKRWLDLASGNNGGNASPGTGYGGGAAANTQSASGTDVPSVGDWANPSVGQMLGALGTMAGTVSGAAPGLGLAGLGLGLAGAAFNGDTAKAATSAGKAALGATGIMSSLGPLGSVVGNFAAGKAFGALAHAFGLGSGEPGPNEPTSVDSKAGVDYARTLEPNYAHGAVYGQPLAAPAGANGGDYGADVANVGNGEQASGQDHSGGGPQGSMAASGGRIGLAHGGIAGVDMIGRLMRGSGLVPGTSGGRADKIKAQLPKGAYVLPADVVSAAGQGNTMAGAAKISKAVKQFPKFAQGGAVEAVPVRLSGGEYVMHPHHVAALGNGDLQAGHAALDQMISTVRARNARQTAALPPPK